MKEPDLSIVEKRTRDDPVPWVHSDGLFTFRYSHTEISAYGENIHAKRTGIRFADGKLTSEEWEGTLDRAVYDGMVRDAQAYCLNQMAGFMKLLALPFSLGIRGGRRRE